jgi:hypothetical protein
VGFIEMLLDEGNGERTRAIFLGDVSVRANIYREETGQIYLEKEDIHIPPRTKDLLAVTHILLVPTLKKWAAPVSTILLTLAGKPPKDILTTWIRAAKP